MPDNVVQMPTSLDRLAGKIKHALERREQSREEWIASTLELCESLAEARREFKADIAFGRWCEASAFDINAMDRAAAVAMGQHLEEARAVLQVTERRSLQLIYRKECRFISANKPKSSTKRNPGHGKRRKVSDEQSAELASAILDQGKTHEEAAELFGVSDTVVRTAVAHEVGKREGKQEGPPPDPATFSKTRQADYERAVRATEERLRVEIRAEERKRLETQYDEVYLPHINAKVARADRILASHQGLISRANYRKVLAALHPDNSASPATRAEAFRIIKELEPVLLKPEPKDDPNIPPLPQTVADLNARRKKTR